MARITDSLAELLQQWFPDLTESAAWSWAHIIAGAVLLLSCYAGNRMARWSGERAWRMAKAAYARWRTWRGKQQSPMALAVEQALTDGKVTMMNPQNLGYESLAVGDLLRVYFSDGAVSFSVHARTIKAGSVPGLSHDEMVWESWQPARHEKRRLARMAHRIRLALRDAYAEEKGLRMASRLAGHPTLNISDCSKWEICYHRGQVYRLPEKEGLAVPGSGKSMPTCSSGPASPGSVVDPGSVNGCTCAACKEVVRRATAATKA